MLLQLFSRFAQIFVAIELLTFFKYTKSHFYYSIELSVFGIFKFYT